MSKPIPKSCKQVEEEFDLESGMTEEEQERAKMKVWMQTTDALVAYCDDLIEDAIAEGKAKLVFEE